VLAYAGWSTPRILVGAFNPVTINVSVVALAVLALMLNRKEGIDIRIGESRASQRMFFKSSGEEAEHES
jgi:hypothetical protein